MGGTHQEEGAATARVKHDSRTAFLPQLCAGELFCIMQRIAFLSIRVLTGYTCGCISVINTERCGLEMKFTRSVMDD
jgi:hypothetical protein